MDGVGRIVTFKDGSEATIVHVSYERYRGKGFNTIEWRSVTLVEFPDGTRRTLYGRDVASVREPPG